MRISIFAGLLFTAFVGLGVACGGGDDKASSSPTVSGAVATSTATGDGSSATTATKTPKPTSTKKTTAASAGSVDEYFRDLAARFEMSRNDSDAATSDFNTKLDAATTLAEQKQVIKDFLDAMIQVFDDSILTMNGFSVPAIAKAPHFQFRDDIVQAKAISKTLKTDIDAAQTAAEAQAVIDDFNVRVVALVDDAQSACRELQSIADQQNSSADLQCKAA